MSLAELPAIVRKAWEALGDPRVIVDCEETSPGVSTNAVFRLALAPRGQPSPGPRGRGVFAKVSSYGSYIHFRQDHARITQLGALLQQTRYAQLLAPVLERNSQVFTYEADGKWVVFYGEVARRGVMRPQVPLDHIAVLGGELARFHACCDGLRERLSPSWKTVGADIALLYDELDQSSFRNARGITASEAKFLKAQCDAFLENAEALGYHDFHRLPVFLDWNRGNFSVEYYDEGFSLFSRWDYDWFRIEPRVFDFYFLSRLVRAEGDQSTFHYLPDPLLEPRFARFLTSYHVVFPLTSREVLFLKEAYRFFVLNYVIRSGEHFFVPELNARLAHEALRDYLPRLDALDFRALLGALQ